MKFLTEYRDPELAQRYLEEIKKTATRPWTIMEVCGGQTHSLVKNGILNMLPKEINMVHGPGCPVCVTPLSLIDKAALCLEVEGDWLYGKTETDAGWFPASANVDLVPLERGSSPVPLERSSSPA